MFQITAMDAYGNNIRELLTEKDSIAKPIALAAYQLCM